MIIKKEWKEILKNMLNQVNDEYDKTEGSLFYDNLAPVSIEIEEIRKTLEYIFLNSFAETAEGEYLDNICKEVGVFRRKATKSKGTVIIKGVPGTVVEVNTKVASDTYIYLTTQEKIISAAGSVEVPIESEKYGKIYNIPKGTITNFPVTIPGLNEVINNSETVDGYDGETDDELRERYYFKVREPVTSGNIYHYKKWAFEVEGVGGVKVFPLWNGNGTVKVVVVNSDIHENEVINNSETVDGYDGETDDELRERYYFKVREPVTSGNIYHYKKWAFEVEGVGGVKVFPLWNGNGTVKVVVVNSDIHEADETLLKRVRDYLEEVRPIGATVTVKSAIGKAISISGTVKISKNIKFDEVKTEFETKVKEYFRKVGFKQDYVSYAQLGNILLNIQGVSDYDDLKINNTTLNVQLAAEEIPKLTTITLQKEVI